YRQQGNLTKARAMLEFALTGRERLCGENGDAATSSANELAHVFFCKGDMDKAEELYYRTLHQRIASRGSKSPRTIETMIDLATVYNRRHPELARPLYLQALRSCRETLDPKHRISLKAISSLAAHYVDGGQNDLALPLYLEAYLGYNHRLGRRHPTSLQHAHDFAVCLMNLQRTAAAEMLLVKLQEWCSAELGEADELTLAVTHSLGKNALEYADFRRAEEQFWTAWTGRKQTLGERHVLTIESLYQLVPVYDRQGKQQQALDACVHVLQARERSLVLMHPDAVEVMLNLAKRYGEQGQLIEAERLFRKAQKGCDLNKGPKHKMTINASHMHALILAILGKLGEAETLLRKCVHLFYEVYGVSHVKSVTVTFHWGLVLGKQGRFDDAIKSLHLARRDFGRTLGADHHMTL
ncbi:TPR-like protein, partial [Piedraia hortae CBS 480.64]